MPSIRERLVGWIASHQDIPRDERRTQYTLPSYDRYIDKMIQYLERLEKRWAKEQEA